MESIVVKEIHYEITNKNRDKLKESGAIYWCDEHEAYHLTPDHEFTLNEVEILMNCGED